MSSSTAVPSLPPTHIRVTLTTQMGTSWELHLHRDTRVAQLKEFVATHMHVAVERQSLIFGGRVLGDGKMCDDWGVKDGSTVMLVPILQSGLLHNASFDSASPRLAANPATSDLISRGLQSLTEDQVSTLLARRAPTVFSVQVDDHVVVFTVMPKDGVTSISPSVTPILGPLPELGSESAMAAPSSPPRSPFMSFNIAESELPSHVGGGKHSRAVVQEPTAASLRNKMDTLREKLASQRLARNAPVSAAAAPSVKVAAELEVIEPVALPEPASMTAEPAAEPAAPSMAAPVSSAPQKRVKTAAEHNSCKRCSKRLSLIGGYACRCGGKFCSNHRHAEDHECTFDYKTMERQLLAKQNPLVTAQKISYL